MSLTEKFWSHTHLPFVVILWQWIGGGGGGNQIGVVVCPIRITIAAVQQQIDQTVLLSLQIGVKQIIVECGGNIHFSAGRWWRRDGVGVG